MKSTSASAEATATVAARFPPCKSPRSPKTSPSPSSLTIRPPSTLTARWPDKKKNVEAVGFLALDDDGLAMLARLDRTEDGEARKLTRRHILDDTSDLESGLRLEPGQLLGHLESREQPADLAEPFLDDRVLVDEPVVLPLTQTDGLARPVRHHVGHAEASLVTDPPLPEAVGLDECRDDS